MTNRDCDFTNPAVKSVFENYPEPTRARLLALRALILKTASRTDGVGAIEETLKWGQPSYLTPETGSGSTIRIDQVRDNPGQYAMYFHCQTNLVESFRNRYPELMRFVGNRSIVFDADDAVPEEALSHCIAMGLTYHLRKKAGSARELTWV